MSAKTLILTLALVCAGSAGRLAAEDTDSAPAPASGGPAFDRIDLNHDGVIQREEFDQARAHRGERRGPGRGDGARRRGPAGGQEMMAKFVDEAVDRALEKSAGDPQKLRETLRDELKSAFEKGRALRRGPDEAPPAPGDAPQKFNARRGAGNSDGGVFGQPDRFQRRRGRGDFQRMDPAKRSEQIMTRLDANHDGVLSADELGERGDRLLKADANHDGKIDAEELKGFLQNVKDRGGHRHRGQAESGGSETPAPPANE